MRKRDSNRERERLRQRESERQRQFFWLCINWDSVARLSVSVSNTFFLLFFYSAVSEVFGPLD